MNIQNDFLTLQEIKKYKKIKSSANINEKTLFNLNILPIKGKLYKKSDIDLLAKLLKNERLKINWRSYKIQIVEQVKKVNIFEINLKEE